jgi:tetratricopeptide (TPR) repeat protein
MRRTTPTYGLQVVLLASALPVTAWAQAPATAGQPQPQRQAADRYLATYQIDRYDAILQVRQALVKDPSNLNDWIILGELAQEVATDVASREAPGYYTLARESYESALKLKPDDANLKAAAHFARDQEQASEPLAEKRRSAASAYLSARRRELAAPGTGPTLRVYSAFNPSAGSSYYYQPYATSGGQPYTYQRHAEVYFSPADVPVESNHPIGATERAALVKPAAAFAPP